MRAGSARVIPAEPTVQESRRSGRHRPLRWTDSSQRVAARREKIGKPTRLPWHRPCGTSLGGVRVTRSNDSQGRTSKTRAPHIGVFHESQTCPCTGCRSGRAQPRGDAERCAATSRQWRPGRWRSNRDTRQRAPGARHAATGTTSVLRAAATDLRPATTGLRPATAGLRPATTGLRAAAASLRAATAGLRAATAGLRAATAGLRATAASLRAAAASRRAAATGLRSAATGLRAAATGLRPAATGLRAASTGLRAAATVLRSGGAAAGTGATRL